MFIRSLPFSILRDTAGRPVCADEFLNFFFGLHKLQSSTVEQCQIKFENMSEEERTIVVTHFRSGPNVNILTPFNFHTRASIKTLKTVRHGVIEFRVNIVPEFEHFFNSDEIAKMIREIIEIERIVNLAIVCAEIPENSTKAMIARCNLYRSANTISQSITSEYHLED